MIMMVLHVTFNYMPVRAVCLRTLNEPRFLLLIEKYLRHEMISTPCQINRIEPIIFYQMGPCILDLKICGFKIKNLDGSIFEVFKGRIPLEYISRLRVAHKENPSARQTTRREGEKEDETIRERADQSQFRWNSDPGIHAPGC